MWRCGVFVVFMDFNFLNVVFNQQIEYKVPQMTIDKRDVGDVFRERLAELAGRHGGNQAAFARAIGLDRSALRQLMAPGSTRLPRAETLCRIAEQHSVSLDWLLGLSQSDSVATEISTTLDDGEEIVGVLFYVEPDEFDVLLRDGLRIAEEYADWDAVPDLHDFVQAVEHEFETLRKL